MSTSKEILGWHVDSLAMTIQLTARRHAHFKELLDNLPRSRSRVSLKEWHKILGELRSMCLAIPGTLQTVLSPGKRRLCLTNRVHDFLDDFWSLGEHLHQRPRRIYELFPTEPTIIGSTNASGKGMGGVFFIPTAESMVVEPQYEAYVWRGQFPQHMVSRLVTRDNPEGDVTNSDLELTATVAHHDVIVGLADVAKATLCTLHDNTPAVFWNRRGSTTTQGPATYLLRLQSLHAQK